MLVEQKSNTPALIMLSLLRIGRHIRVSQTLKHIPAFGVRTVNTKSNTTCSKCDRSAELERLLEQVEKVDLRLLKKMADCDTKMLIQANKVEEESIPVLERLSSIHETLGKEIETFHYMMNRETYHTQKYLRQNGELYKMLSERFDRIETLLCKDATDRLLTGHLPDWALEEASKLGSVKIVNELLNRDLHFDSQSRVNAIELACLHGHLPVLERLLQDTRLDPSSNDNTAILWAESKGHFHICKRLLQDHRVRNTLTSEQLEDLTDKISLE